MKDKVKIHNREVIASAEYRAGEMRTWPSPLEERMKFFLEEHNIPYENQKIFYIRAKDGWIMKYYIADFFIAYRSLIIEVDGKQHDKHRLHDKMRTMDIQKHYPNVSVVRFNYKDLSDSRKLKSLHNLLV